MDYDITSFVLVIGIFATSCWASYVFYKLGVRQGVKSVKAPLPKAFDLKAALVASEIVKTPEAASAVLAVVTAVLGLENTVHRDSVVAVNNELVRQEENGDEVARNNDKIARLRAEIEELEAQNSDSRDYVTRIEAAVEVWASQN